MMNFNVAVLLQARVIDLERMAIRPFSCHKAKIRAVAVVSPSEYPASQMRACFPAAALMGFCRHLLKSSMRLKA
eukprot:scaffold290114_cov17-Tisochrysis_lutea.AAC.3